MGCVVKRIADKRKRVIEKVGDIMDGIEWLERYDAAVAGGKAKGEEKQLVRQVSRKLRKGKIPWQIAEDLDEDEVRFIDIYNIANDFATDYENELVIKTTLAYETT